MLCFVLANDLGGSTGNSVLRDVLKDKIKNVFKIGRRRERDYSLFKGCLTLSQMFQEEF